MAFLAQTLVSYLPGHDGMLPIWLLIVSVVSVANSIQAYSTTTYTARVYSGSSTCGLRSSSNSAVTPLSSRTFGTWTMIQSLVRFYAAYNISDSSFYQIALLTYAVAFAHFMSEWLIFKTARWGAGLSGPLFVSTGTLVWMYLQWEYYVR